MMNLALWVDPHVLSSEKEADVRNKVCITWKCAILYISALSYRSTRRNAMRHRLLAIAQGGVAQNRKTLAVGA
jgi:hypothetical protein